MEVTPEKLVFIVIRPPELFSEKSNYVVNSTGQKNKKKIRSADSGIEVDASRTDNFKL